MSPIPASDVLDKLKGIVRDRLETWALIVGMLFCAGWISQILWKRAAQIKDFENVLSWLITALVVLMITLVAGEAVQKPKRERHPKQPALGDTKP